MTTPVVTRRMARYSRAEVWLHILIVVVAVVGLVTIGVTNARAIHAECVGRQHTNDAIVGVWRHYAVPVEPAADAAPAAVKIVTASNANRLAQYRYVLRTLPHIAC